MYTEICIYFEGDDLLRPGFGVFFSELRRQATKRRCRFRLVAGGSGEGACRDFGTAIRTNPATWNILLRDSEGPADAKLSVSLCRTQAWDESHADSIFWMVQMMEAWLHADKNALGKFYGAGFKENALKRNPNVEEILKKDLEDGLKAATKDTQKGNYYDRKTEHGPKLLAAIKPGLVRKAAPNCQKLFEAVLATLA
jgi:hypothetical protein